jgi:hypothetical protein
MGGARSPAPFVIIRNRMQLVQVEHGDRLINILVNPTDPERSKRAPFIRKQLERYGKALSTVLLKKFSHGTVADHLAAVGVAPEEVDYITYDHLHVQDVRGLLGTGVPEPGSGAPTAALLPNAKLIAQREELETLASLHPFNEYWYVRDCLAGVAKDKVIGLDGDYLVGGGFAIVRTPGHTYGNHSPTLYTDSGLWTISENGIAAECYAPEHSKIPGVRRYARHFELEVVMNGNTREDTLKQYTSMVLEKTLADPSRERPEFPQHFSSSELEASPLALGLKPTFSHKHITHGKVRTKAAHAANRSAA